MEKEQSRASTAYIYLCSYTKPCLVFQVAVVTLYISWRERHNNHALDYRDSDDSSYDTISTMSSELRRKIHAPKPTSRLETYRDSNDLEKVRHLYL